MIYVDLDDFIQAGTGWSRLRVLKSRIPKFRVTLFTIVGRVSQDFVKEVQDVGFANVVPHGWLHLTPRECERWTYEESMRYLDKIEPWGMTQGFKAPGWQISDGMYRALLERGYWVADQAYNNHRRPPKLPVYLLDSPNKIHGHLGHLGGYNSNELDLIMPEIMQVRNGDFGFVNNATTTI